MDTPTCCYNTHLGNGNNLTHFQMYVIKKTSVLLKKQHELKKKHLYEQVFRFLGIAHMPVFKAIKYSVVQRRGQFHPKIIIVEYK